jgi:hypothetical protein
MQVPELPPQTKGAHGGRPAAPKARFVHVPTFPEALQTSQGPAHSELQHTSSTHFPDVHCRDAAQGLPFGSFATQLAAEQ